LEGPFWGWSARIAPYLEQGNALASANMNGATGGASWPWWQMLPDGSNSIVSTKMKVFQCPSDRRSSLIWGTRPFQAALTTYLAVCGRDHWKETGSGKLPGQDGAMYINSSVNIAYITDGTSNTVMVGERPPAVGEEYGWIWAAAGYDHACNWGEGDQVLGVRSRLTSPSDPPDFYRPGTIHDAAAEHVDHYWSLHPQGGLWLVADGSVRFINYTAGTRVVTQISGINVTLMEALASIAGGETFSE
jgi:hypothetical protein